MIMAQNEFLPLCDVLFNIISLAAYFCDVVFDLVMGYALFVHKKIEWFTGVISLALISSAIEQIVSFKWYLNTRETREVSNNDKDADLQQVHSLRKVNFMCIVFLHFLQFGVLWRYFKLFIPVDLRFVKYEVRDLCMLRLIHAFCQSMPLLLIELYLYSQNLTTGFRDLNLVSLLLSLFNVCWALASFSKNVRMHKVHLLVLTWLGVIFQFFWRLGTVSARAISLTAYASLFRGWIFLVIFLHWISMLLWILSPKNLFHGERLSYGRKALLYPIIAFVYTFAYINLLEINHREKMVTYYVIMGLENAMLMFVWVVGVTQQSQPPWYCAWLPLAVFLLFGAGICFMALYYRYFHVRRLKYEAGGRLDNNSTIANGINNNNNDDTSVNNNNNNNNLNGGIRIPVDKDQISSDKELIRRHSFSGCYNSTINDLNIYSRMHNENSVSGEEGGLPQQLNFEEDINNIDAVLPVASAGNHNHRMPSGIPGVFNCRFSNPYTAAVQKRKRKKPTSFVPPPSIEASDSTAAAVVSMENKQSAMAAYNVTLGCNSVPFWCRPLPNNQQNNISGGCGNGSENECSSVGSRPDIQQKLQEKKQKQLAELRKIEEEIRQGKLHRRPDEAASPAAPPPQDKKAPPQCDSGSEILLAPHYLHEAKDENCHHHHHHQYYDWRGETETRHEDIDHRCHPVYRSPSDLESQLSLPRSYTLPREFRYYRRTKPRKPLRADQFINSTNSSDGDVDSGDDSGSTSSHTISQPLPLRLPPRAVFVKHETKL